MKNTYKYILALAAALSFACFTARADDERTENDQVVTNKTVTETPDANGVYTLTLETYVTGAISTSTSPLDIVLVLDVSGSMSYNTVIVDTRSARLTKGTELPKDRDKLYIYVKDGKEYYLRYRISNIWCYSSSTTSPTIFNCDGTLTSDIEWFVAQPYEVKSSDEIYEITYHTATKLSLLKTAVISFIKKIEANANDKKINHRVSIVKFASDDYANDENHLQEGNHTGYSELVKNLTSVYNNAANVKALEDAVDALVANDATAADYGMTIASEVLNQEIVTSDRVKAVVMFTDGEPTYESSFSTTVANNTISKSKEMKDKNTTVYTVGIFDSLDDNTEGTDINTYMTYTSSDYPSAESMTVSGSKNTSTIDYSLIVDEGGKMNDIFDQIAGEIISIPEYLDEKALILDVITESFSLPAGADKTSIKLYTSKAMAFASDGTVTTWATKLAAPNEVAPNVTVVTATTNSDGTSDIVVKGFDFGAHWVGSTAPDPQKLIIEIPIVPKDDTVGGEDIDTNKGESGIYTPDENDPDKPGDPVEEYPIPDVDLPVKIQITKTGLQPGESAVFTIYKRATGSADEDANYSYFTKVILTGSATDASPKVVLKDLSPHFIYKIVEGDWSWTYKITNETGTSQTTEGVYLNPFKFSNAKKNEDVPQNNAEAIAHNVFEKTK